jgi:hypothetical protein
MFEIKHATAPSRFDMCLSCPRPSHRSFLNALGVSSKEDTGVPQLSAELGRVISKAQASLQPALARYASILSSMEARLAHEPPGTFDEAGGGSCASPRDREAMELLFSDLEGGVSGGGRPLWLRAAIRAADIGYSDY